MGKNTVRLTESQLHKVVKESVKRVLSEMNRGKYTHTTGKGAKRGISHKSVLRESDDEFTYTDSVDLGKGRHRQIIIYNGKEIGYLLSIEKNWLAPIEERYILPDIEYGMQPDEGGSMLDGKKGWIDFKVFKNYDEALKYASQNYKKLAYLFEYGDYD